MGKIIELDKNLANQISAWEVVERPISVVKELIENSIDAWAKNIKLEIKDWWKQEIRVIDDGSWIEKDDLKLAIKKYSTSKIKSLKDLYNIMTFWFRWEALASISSVSNTVLSSKNIESDKWYEIEIDWWEEKEISESAIDKWTSIVVKNLFFNTPARLNYLKTTKTEYSKIYEFIQQMSIIYPEIWFEFISDNKQIFKLNNNENIENRIYKIFWEEFLKSLLKIEADMVGVKIKWFISTPETFFTTKNRQLIFINKRIVTNPTIYKAIMNAYNRFIPHMKFPWYILDIEVDPTIIDVNVHPRKSEVRFANEQEIYRGVYNAILWKLENHQIASMKILEEQNFWSVWDSNEIKSLNQEEENYNLWEIKTFQENQNKQESFYTWSWTKQKNYSPYKEFSFNPSQGIIWEIPDNIWWEAENKESFEEKNEIITDIKDTKIWKIVWQIFNSYILVEWNDKSLHMIDQHAFAERILYEKLTKREEENISQTLLIPRSIKLSPKEMSICSENKDTFIELWFDFEEMPNSSIIINSIPTILDENEIEEVFIWMLEDIWLHNWKAISFEEKKNKIYAYTACRASIKFWNKLSIFEMNKLINDWMSNYNATCPHWRQSVKSFHIDEIKKFFDR